MDERESYLKQAFLSQYNVVLLGAAAVLSVVALSPLPLLVAAGAELVYLGTVPNLPGYRRRIRQRREQRRRADEHALLERMLAELSANQREYYFALRDLRDHTLDNYRRLSGGRALVDTSQARLDGLLVAFVRLLNTLENYRRYLGATDRAALERELGSLRRDLGSAASAADPEPLRAIKGRRVEILEQRVKRFDQAANSRELVSHQLASIEDFLRLLHEQSITLRDPDLIGSQLEHVALDIQATDETVREMERFMAFRDEIDPIRPPERERQRAD